MADRPLWQLSAVEAVQQLRAGQVTPLQLVEAAEQRWKVCIDSNGNLDNKRDHSVVKVTHVGSISTQLKNKAETCSSTCPSSVLSVRVSSSAQGCTCTKLQYLSTSVPHAGNQCCYQCYADHMLGEG